MTHRGVAVHDRDSARRGGEGFRAHDREGLIEGHHLARYVRSGRNARDRRSSDTDLRRSCLPTVEVGPCESRRYEPNRPAAGEIPRAAGPGLPTVRVKQVLYMFYD